MHIPSSMLHGSICPVTAAFATTGLGLSALIASKLDNKPSAAQFAAVTAMIFALQMLNFPVASGTSGHFLGGVLAVLLLGVPFAVLSVSLVLAVQAIFFGDGAINALGANIINMAFMATAAAGIFLKWLEDRGIQKSAAIAFASFAGVVLAAVACSWELAVCGSVAFHKVLTAMVSVHAIIGIGEGLITLAVIFLLRRLIENGRKKQNAVAIASFSVAVGAAILSPLACRFPDGVESVAKKFLPLKFPEVFSPAFFQDYQAAFMGHGCFSMIFSALAGVVIISTIIFAGQRFFKTS